jgi:hypothetical protein
MRKAPASRNPEFALYRMNANLAPPGTSSTDNGNGSGNSLVNANVLAHCLMASAMVSAASAGHASAGHTSNDATSFDTIGPTNPS